MLSSLRTCAIAGVDAISVDVQVRVSEGPPKFTIIGLGDGAVRESRDRVVSALCQSGFHLPDQVLVNLAPAEIKKEGSSFDLSIALGVLAASGQIPAKRCQGRCFLGELGLDGRIKPVRGMIALAIEAMTLGTSEVIAPMANLREGLLVGEVSVYGFNTLLDVVGYLKEDVLPEQEEGESEVRQPGLQHGYISEVWGQESAKRALLIAASGGHNALMIGPPGCGKSMLAQRFPSLLPPLSPREMLETVKIHSVLGLPVASLLGGERPFRSPHYVVSDVGLIGGSANPRPGEISLAHHGVLFLDEFPEFKRSALEALRAPMESGQVRIARAKSSVLFPAEFQLIAAMNPCPCGRLGVGLGSGQKPCMCSRPAIDAYLRKLSQPILERIDLQIELEPVPLSVLVGSSGPKVVGDEEALRGRVLEARQRQEQRFGKQNGRVGLNEIKRKMVLAKDTERFIGEAMTRLCLSARSYVRLLRVSMTIADMSGEDAVRPEHVAEALSYRGLSRLESYVSVNHKAGRSQAR